jgi:hypothetical protein
MEILYKYSTLYMEIRLNVWKYCTNIAHYTWK